METIHEFDHDGKRYRFVPDENYRTRGSYAYDTEEETRAAEDAEIEKLESGEWTVVGCLVLEPCDIPGERHCEGCSGWTETDSLWGIVVDSTNKAMEQFVKDGGI